MDVQPAQTQAEAGVPAAQGGPSPRWCGMCGNAYDDRYDGCPGCGRKLLQSAKHLSEIRNLIAFMIVFGFIFFAMIGSIGRR